MIRCPEDHATSRPSGGPWVEVLLRRCHGYAARCEAGLRLAGVSDSDTAVGGWVEVLLRRCHGYAA